MYRLPLIILILLGCLSVFAQTPHGDELKIDCAQCHNSDSWLMNYETIQFNHNITDFKLEGAHDQTNCTECHTSLIFDEAPSQCASCHEDIHSMSVGNDCVRCHTSQTWLVDNIPELHEENGFPLIGAHSTLSCVDCHLSETNLRFDRIGNECINCHKEDYINTQSPNHESSGFGTDCIDCHNPLGIGWETDFVDHDFFPLTLGHDIQDCNQCHFSSDFSDISSECISCHQNDYNESTNPNHQTLNFTIDCVVCHTTDPDWMPARFDDHDAQFFPIYSGEHKGEWDDCIDCHTNPNNYSEFTCTTCHSNPETDENHNGISGYFYEDNACFACHPTGSKGEGFDHNSTNFPLTGGHLGIDCNECHTTGNYSDASPDCVTCHQNDYDNTNNPNHSTVGFSTDCVSCHTTNPGWTPATIDHDFFPLTLGHDIQDCNQCHITNNYSDASPDCISCHNSEYSNTTNPNHNAIGISTDCVVCHTTNPNWMPASFDNHNDYYQLNGAHANIANDCAACHNGDYNNTPNTCIGCHQADYNAATNPNHISAQFPDDCMLCHTETAWEPSTFDHDGQYFPIYSGAHQDEWNNCTDCHTNTSNYSIFTCITCHTSSETNNDHSEVSGYVYESNACFECHPNGEN